MPFPDCDSGYLELFPILFSLLPSTVRFHCDLFPLFAPNCFYSHAVFKMDFSNDMKSGGSPENGSLAPLQAYERDKEQDQRSEQSETLSNGDLKAWVVILSE